MDFLSCSNFLLAGFHGFGRGGGLLAGGLGFFLKRFEGRGQIGRSFLGGGVIRGRLRGGLFRGRLGGFGGFHGFGFFDDGCLGRFQALGFYRD